VSIVAGLLLAMLAAAGGAQSAKDPLRSSVEPRAKLTLRPGDVIANAPLGVLRSPPAQPPSRGFYSPMLGVVRTPAPPPARTRLIYSPGVGVFRGSGIRDIEPDTLSIGVADQRIEVFGTGLTVATSATITPATGVTIAALTPDPTGDRIELRVSVASDAVPGARRLSLRTATGQTIAELVPGAGAIVLSDAEPVVESVEPVLLPRGQTQLLTIRGRNLRGLPFGQFATAALPNEQPRVQLLPEAGIVIATDASSNTAGTLVTVSIDVTGGAALGERVVQVLTASGASSATASAANTVRVVDGPLRQRTPFVSPLLGVTRGGSSTTTRLAYAPALGVVRGPAILELDPISVAPGTTARLRLGGRELNLFTGVVIAPGSGITIDTGSLSISPTSVTFDVAVAADAPLDSRRITLTAPSRSLDAPRLLEVRAAPPTLTALTPTFIVRDGSSQTIELQGERLAQTTSASVIPDAGFVIENYSVLSNTRASLRLRAAPGTALGARVVQVNAPSGGSSTTSAPGNTFYLVDPILIRSPFVAPLLGVRKEAATTPGSTRFGFSPALGVVRGRFATGVTPARVERGRTTRVTVAGRELGGVDAVQVLAPDGVTVQNVAAAADGRSVSFDLVIAADVSASLRRVELRAGGVPVPFVPPSAATLEVVEVQVVAPIAAPDSYTALANAALDVDAANGVLRNDIDPNGGTLYAVLRRLPARGSLNLRSDGGFTYTPDADFVGTDRFEYSAGAGNVVGEAAAVTLTVAERNDARDDAYSVNDSGLLVVAAANGLLANDIIATGAQVTIERISNPTLGVLTLAADGSFTYRPNGPAGTDRFRYRLLENGVPSLPAEVAITITAVNDPPVAADDRYSVNRGTTLTVAAPGVLANDADPDDARSSLTVRALTQPSDGALVLNTNGSFTYTPPTQFTGLVQFDYEVRDPQGLIDSATVIIDVNNGLAPLPDEYSFNEGEVLFIDAPGLLANDSLIATGPVRVELAQAPTPALGTVTLANDGSFVFRPNTPDTNGLTSFQYRLRDNATVSSPATVRIAIAGVNDAPSTGADRYVSDENAELIVPAPGVLLNDSDVESSTLSAQLLAAPARGVVTIRADGSFNYVPEVNWRGTETFTYSALDAQGGSTPGTVTIQVTQPPTATNDVYLVDVDTTLTVADGNQGLLANDHDAPENDPLEARLNEGPRNGTLTLAPDGTFVYTPARGFSGLDIVKYQVTDGRSISNIGTVTLAVGITSLPRANPDEYEMTEDVELVVPAAQGVLVNDTDADTPRAQLQAALVGYDLEAVSSIQVNGDGSFRVRTAQNFFGETFFAYQVFDGTDISNVAIVKLTVSPVNDGVEALDDRFGVLRNTVLVAEGFNGITRNDRWDPDFEVRFEVTVPPQFGTAELNPATGALRYTPQRDFAGLDSFTYRLFQVATGVSDTAIVTLRTNGPPIAVPDAYTVPEDALTTVTPSPIANDSDPDGDPIQLVSTVFGDGIGWVSVSVDRVADPTLTRVTTTSHFYGQRKVFYSIADGTATTYGEINVTVTPVPDDPRGSNDSYLTRQNTPLIINLAAQGVQGNDYDPDARPGPGSPPWAAAIGVDLQPLRATLLGTTTNGNLTFNQDGTFSYVPNSGFSGTDRFSYRLTDGTGRTSTSIDVSIRVNSPSVARDDTYVTNEDVVLAVPPAQGVLSNDSDPDNDLLRAQFAGSGCAPCNGRVSLSENGSFRYTPNTNFHGSDEFFYRANDGIEGSAVARVAITVLPVNDAPVTEPDTYRTPEDVVLVAPQAQGVLRNDREVDGEQLTRAELVSQPQRGAIVFGADGRFTYTPDVNFNGRDSFRYRVFDQSNLAAENNVEIQITSVNDAPVAAPDAYETRKDMLLNVSAASGVLANDRDVDGPRLSAALIGSPLHGQLTLAPDGSFEYRPNGIFVGIDRFQYQVDDGLGEVASATVAINVRDVPGPVAVTAEDDFYRFPAPELAMPAPGVLANDRATGGATLNASVVVAPTSGTLSLAADGSFTYRANAGFSGVDGFTYGAIAGGVTEIARVTLDVVATTNAPPVAVGEQFAVIEDGLLDSRSVGGLLVNDSDPEGASLTLTLLEGAQRGELALQADGHFIYRPNADVNGRDTFTYRVSDGTQSSGVATATITVFAQNDAPRATPDQYQGQIGQPLSIPAANGILANDSDVDGDALSVALIDAPLSGQILANADGSFVYTPFAGFSGTDRFRYAATDGQARDIAEVTIVIASGGNRAPIARGEEFAIAEDTVLSSATVGALTANDNDPDGDPLSVILTQEPRNGALRLDGAEFEYRPRADFAGSDAFAYRVTDGALSSAEVTVAIRVNPVNDAPIANEDLYTTARARSLSVPASNGVLANDSDIEGDSMTASLASAPKQGSVVLASDGSFTYVPNGSFTGRDEFTYQLSDGTAQATGRVGIDVTLSGNRRPIANGEQYMIPEDSVLDTRQTESLLANDSDPEGSPLTWIMLNPPARGTLEQLSGGHVRYLPQRDDNSEVTLSYTVSDGELSAVPVQLSIMLSPRPDPPLAQADLYRVPAGETQLSVSAAQGLLANDSDPDGEALVARLVGAPPRGTLILGLDGSFVYRTPTPTPSQITFRYRVEDASSASAEAEVTILMNASAGSDEIFASGYESPTP
jgi:hypothetical protein